MRYFTFFILRIVLISLALITHSSFAKEDISVKERAQQDFTNITFDSWEMLRSPLNWDRQDYLNLGLVVGGSALFSLLDEDIRQMGLFKEKTRNKDKIEKTGSTWGTFVSVGLVTGISIGEGIFTGNQWARETGNLLTSSLLISGIISSIGKKSIGRLRPNNNSDQYEFKPFNSNVAYHSTPSGHISYAMTASMALAEQMESYTMKTFFWGIGLMSGFARVYSNAHWPSDILLTSSISYFIVRNEKNRIINRRGGLKQEAFAESKKGQDYTWNILPLYNGLQLVVNY